MRCDTNHTVYVIFQAAILLSNLPFESVGKTVEIEQLCDAVNLILSLQVL
jgi:hypothetical protein